MAENRGPSQQKKEHPAVTLNKDFNAILARINRLETSKVEDKQERIAKLHQEALGLLQQMKELDDRSVRNILRDYRTGETIFELEQKLNPIIKQAEKVISDAEAKERAIRELLAEADTEKAEIAVEISKTKEEVREERRVAICKELEAQWVAKKGPTERPLSAQERVGMSPDMLTRLTEEYSEYFFDHRGNGRNSVPAQAERILLQRFPEYRQAEDSRPPVQEPTPLPEPAPSPVVTIDTVAVGADSAEAPTVEEGQPPAQPAPTPDKPKRGRKPKKQVPDPAIAPADTEEAPNIDQESWLTQEVNTFIAEFGLEEFLPKDFRKLKQEQQLKTIRDLKQRIVDIVKQDAKAHHTETVNNQKAHANIFGKLAIGVREAFQKESAIKNEEKAEFEKIKGTKDGRELVAEQMKLLADINRSQDIIVGENGELLVDYTSVLNVGEFTEGVAAGKAYNVAANAFRTIPYEWGLAKEGSKQKQDYDTVKAEYEKALEMVLSAKQIKAGEAQAIKDVIEIKNSLTLEQLLNSHPEIEIEFGKLEQGAGKEQVWATIRRLVGVQNREKVALFATGYAARTLTKATLGAIAMPIVGAVFGGIRAKSKAKETLTERRKESRYGTKDTSREAEKFVDADKMADHIDGILNQLEQANLTDEKRISLEKRLQIRIDVALAKIEEGLLSFGNSKQAIAHQYRLTNSLNKALVRAALFDEETKKEVANRTNTIMSFRKENISKARQEYIEEQILMGALRGAGIATAGYIVRAIGESAGWWGGETPAARPYSEETADSKPFVDSKYIGDSPELAKAEEYVLQAEKHYKNAQEYYDNATGEDKQAALEALNGAKAELDFQRKYLEGVASGTIVATEAPVDSAESPVKTDTITRQSTYTPPEKDVATTTPTEEQTANDSTTVSKPKPIEGGEQKTEQEIVTEEKSKPESEQSEPAKRTPKTERPTTKAPKADRGEDRMTTTEDNAPEEQKAGGGPAEEEKPKVNERPVKRVRRDTGTVEAKPRSVPSTPETKATVGDMDPNAVVGEGEGVTFAFKHQIEADPTLGEALKKQIGYQGKIGTKAFYEALGREFGYIKTNGEWIGVSEGDIAAYKFVKVGDSYKVYEYHLKGTEWEIVERHKVGDDFEGEDHEKEYEYLNTPKRKPEVADGGGDEATEPGPSDNGNDQLARKPKVDEGDLNNGQLARAKNVGNGNTDNGQLDRAPKGTGNGTPKPEDDARIKTKTVSRTEKVIPVERKQGTTILESDKQDVKWTIEPGPPDGRPTLVEDFKLVGGKALRMFADRYGYQNLTASQVDFVGQRYRFNLNKIFEKSSDWTDKWSKESATRLLRMDVGNEVKGNKEELSTYIKMLHDAVKASGKKMEPFNDGFVGNKETTKDYILRMLFELEKRGKLETFNEKFDAFMKGHGENTEGRSASDSDLDNTPDAQVNVDQAVKADYENAMISVFSNEHDPRGIGLERWNELKDSESMDAEYFIETTVKGSNAYSGFEAYPGFTKMIDFIQGLHKITRLEPANNEGSDSYINRCLEHIEKSTSAKDNKALEKLLRESSR